MDYIGDLDGRAGRSHRCAAGGVLLDGGALVAAHSVMAGLIARERTGAGQRIEVPLFDACFELIGAGVMKTDKPPRGACWPADDG